MVFWSPKPALRASPGPELGEITKQDLNLTYILEENMIPDAFWFKAEFLYGEPGTRAANGDPDSPHEVNGERSRLQLLWFSIQVRRYNRKRPPPVFCVLVHFWKTTRWGTTLQYLRVPSEFGQCLTY